MSHGNVFLKGDIPVSGDFLGLAMDILLVGTLSLL